MYAWQLAVLAGLLTGVAAVSGILAPMIPVRWGLIALWIGSIPIGYVLAFLAYWHFGNWD